MKSVIFLIAIISFRTGFSQDYTQFWFRASMQCRIHPRLHSIAELHHRTFSAPNTESPFRYPLTSAVRLWLVYKLSDHETINFSLYAFFSNQPQINLEQDIFNSNTNEHRLHLQYEHKISAGKSYSLISRFGGEYRIFERNQDLFRLRIREAINYLFAKNFSLQIYDELFINTMNVDKRHIFDQNRIGMISSLTISEKIRLELGSTLIQNLTRNRAEMLDQLMFQMSWTYSL